MENWRFSEQRMCKSADYELTFKGNYDKISSKGECDSGFKLCGNTLDKENLIQKVCVPDSNTKCPITGLVVAEKNPDALAYTESLSLPGTGAVKMYISRNNGLPLVVYEIDESGVCVNPSERKITSGRSNSSYIKNSKVDCSHDERFKKVDVWNEFDFMKANTGRYETLKDINMADSSIEYGLYAANAVEMKFSCRDKISTYYEFSDQLASLNTNLNVIFIFSIVFTIIVLIVGCFGVIETTSNINEEKKTIGKIKYSSVYIYRALGVLTLVVIFAIILLIWYLRLGSIDSNIQFVSKSNCSDAFTNSDMSSIKDKISDSTSKIIISFALLLVVGLVYTGVVIA